MDDDEKKEWEEFIKAAYENLAKRIDRFERELVGDYSQSFIEPIYKPESKIEKPECKIIEFKPSIKK
jgi:hypothetical protein